MISLHVFRNGYRSPRTAATILPLAVSLLLASLGRTALAEDAAVRARLARDTFSDTWVATDALGRRLPTHAEVGSPRPDRFVGIFYFLWLGSHVTGGPHDVTRILREDPLAMEKKDSPLWGPLHASHHWGESVFGYYVSDDSYVLRKHAQMLTDAGVDAVIFDVTNQVTYKKYYLALLETFSRVRRDGGKAPQVAFLCPFWTPAKVVAELYRDLYEPGLHSELWFRWGGKPLILADPKLLAPARRHGDFDHPVALRPGQTLGQSFTASSPFVAVGGRFPTWHTKGSGATLSLYRQKPGGELIVRGRFDEVVNDTWVELRLPTRQTAGTYYFEMSEPKGTVGWWSHSKDRFPGGAAFVDGKPASGDRTLQISGEDERSERIREFFTFRKPQPDYFQGPTGPDMWSWLEIYPQHVFENSRGEKEQMSVGVAQNAVQGRLGSMSEPGAHGRSFHLGATSQEPGAVLRGLNFAEQFEHALREDPRFIFITGWNEWIMGRFDEFNRVRRPVMFVDQFDHEHSRDIEPMKGGHGDDYYYQMVSFIRRFKGVRPQPPASPPRTIPIDGGFAPWSSIHPEFRDDAGDTAHRDHAGYNDCEQYVNGSGRNDFVSLRVTHDDENVYFYAKTRASITSPPSGEWMVLLLDVDRERRTGWEGYDFAVRCSGSSIATAVLQRHTGGTVWNRVQRVRAVVAGRELHVAVPRDRLGQPASKGTVRLDFKWVDNAPLDGTALDFVDRGDVAPNGRFNYRYEGAPR